MQYLYRAITDSSGQIVSFAVDENGETGLWNMRNFYNWDIRTESRECRIKVPLAALTDADLPKTIVEKVGKVQIGAVQLTIDIPEKQGLGNYLRGMAGLPPWRTPQQILEKASRDKNPDQ